MAKPTKKPTKSAVPIPNVLQKSPTGIGLNMSKNIIENNMGGRLTVRNVAGGAEFRIEV